MALSNIKHEPRREITEQLVGLLAVLAFIGVDYAGVRWAGLTTPVDIALGMLGILALVAAIPLGFLSMIGVHVLGEMICEALGRFDPRPRQRY